MPIPLERNLVPIESPEIMAVKGKKRRKNKKFNIKKMIIFSFAIFLLVFTFMNWHEFMHSVTSLISKISSKDVVTEDNKLLLDSTQPNKPTNPSNKDETFYSIAYPVKTAIINESKYKIDYENLKFSFSKKDKLYGEFSKTSPIALIINFSPTEAYSNSNADLKSYHSQENNVSSIGKEITEKLNELGINALYLSFESNGGSLFEENEAYQQKIKDALLSNPSISYIFDISRETGINNDLTLSKEVINTNGINLPTIKFTCGTSSKSLKENSKMSICLMNALTEFINEKSPLLVSQNTISKYEISQVFDVPCLHVDIGSYACTYEEALLSANLFATYVSSFLT